MLALTSMLSVPALAQDNNHGYGNAKAPSAQNHSQQNPGQQNHGQQRDASAPHSHANQHQTSQHQKHQPKKVMVVKPHQAWKVGHQLPSQYRGNAYRVTNYQAYHLNKPGKNQHWVRVNGDYVLVNILSQSILQIITGR